MSKLVKLKLASKKSLACFLPSSMASSGTSTLFSSAEPEARPRPNGISPKSMVDKPKAENPVRDIVSYGKKKEEPPKVDEPEEILELKTPGFIRVFGCDNCADSDTETRPSHSHHSSSEASDDDDDASTAHHHHHHQPPHLIPVVHLRVPMKNEDDVRKVVAALQIKGVLEVACDLENQIVKVSGNADPDRLLKKVKKVKRKSRLLSYSNPREIPDFHGERPPPPPPPPYAFRHQGPYSVPLRPTAPPRHYDEAFYHHRPPPPTSVRPPPPTPAAFYDEFYRRAPSSPPHYGSRGFYPERSHRSTSPPRRRSYRSSPHFRPPGPVPVRPPVHQQQHYAGGPRSAPWMPGAPYGMDDFHQVPHRTMHMYH